MDTTVTLTVSESEARRILRSVRARENYWSSPDIEDRHEEAPAIRKTYRNTADKLEAQMAAQGVKP